MELEDIRIDSGFSARLDGETLGGGGWSSLHDVLKEADELLVATRHESCRIRFVIYVNSLKVMDLGYLVAWIRSKEWFQPSIQSPGSGNPICSLEVWCDQDAEPLVRSLLMLVLGPPTPGEPPTSRQASWAQPKLSDPVQLYWATMAVRNTTWDANALSDTIPPLLPVDYETLALLRRPIKGILSPSLAMVETADGRPVVELEDTGKAIIELCRANLRPGPASESATGATLTMYKQRLRNKPLWSTLSATPVLSFLMFTLLVRTTIATAGGSAQVRFDHLLGVENQLIMDALDITETLTQTLENAVFHSKSHLGFLSLRLHPKPPSGRHADDSALCLTYPRYMNGHDNHHSPTGGPSSWDLIQQTLPPEWDNTDKFQQHLELLSIIRDRGRTRREGASGRCASYIEMRVLDHSNKGIIDTFTRGGKTRPRELAEYFDPGENRLWWASHAADSHPSGVKDASGHGIPLSNAVMHYGLQITEALVRGMDGCLVVASAGQSQREPLDEAHMYSSSGDCLQRVSGGDETDDSMLLLRQGHPVILPGTQVNMVVPILARTSSPAGAVMAGTDINYSDVKLAQWAVFDADARAPQFVARLAALADDDAANKWRGPRQKYQAIGAGIRDLLGCQVSEHDIVVFDAQRIPYGVAMEVFAKSVGSWIAQRQANGTPDTVVAIKNCDVSRFVDLARFFASFYDRDGYSGAMGHSQIFLAGSDARDQLWLSGEYLARSLAAQIKLSAARGVGGVLGSPLTDLLVRMLTRSTAPPAQGYDKSRQSHEMDESKQLEFAPFDLQVRQGGVSVFDQTVRNVFTAELTGPQGRGFCIDSTHVRIGSKVHQRQFYEAELLFSNGYFVERYAALVAEKLRTSDPAIGDDTPALLVGYGSYGSKLLARLCRDRPDWAYGIYDSPPFDAEETAIETRPSLIHYVRLPSNTQTKRRLVLITCINATMSTFAKLWLQVDRDIREQGCIGKLFDAGQKDSVKLWTRDPVVRINLMWVKPKNPDIAKRFFSDPEMSDQSVTLQHSEPIPGAPVILCVHNVQADWDDPLLCPQCFPPRNAANESPLVGTRSSGVVLDEMFGISRPGEGA